jgi:HlyD family secretion protein
MDVGVPRGDSLHITATVERRELELSFPVAGRLAQLLVSEGDEVEPGQELARLEDGMRSVWLGLRSAEVDEARAALEGLLSAPSAEELALEQARVQLAEEEARRARAQSERETELLRQQVITEAEFALNQTNQRVAEARLGEARARLALLQRGPAESQVAAARARLGAAEQRLEIAATRLAETRLAATGSGRVRALHARVGDQLDAGSRVLSIVRNRELSMSANVRASRAARLRPGLLACVRVPGREPAALEGRVDSVERSAPRDGLVGRLPRWLLGPAQRVNIRLQDDAGVAPGARARAEILLSPAASCPEVG